MTNIIDVLLNRTPLYIKVTRDDETQNDKIEFFLDNKTYVKMYHYQDCCESVWIEDINGSFDKLLYKPILKADEKIDEGENSNDYDSHTYTFYTLAGPKGYVDIRWHGESNGYYSESVDFDVEDFIFEDLPEDVYKYLQISHPELLI